MQGPFGQANEASSALEPCSVNTRQWCREKARAYQQIDDTMTGLSARSPHNRKARRLTFRTLSDKQQGTHEVGVALVAIGAIGEGVDQLAEGDKLEQTEQLRDSLIHDVWYQVSDH